MEGDIIDFVPHSYDGSPIMMMMPDMSRPMRDYDPRNDPTQPKLNNPM